MQGDQENSAGSTDDFVSAADFFRQQQAPTWSGKAAEPVPRRPPRESLLVVARNSQVKNKISAFDRHGGPVAGIAQPAAAAGFARPTISSTAASAGANSGFARPAAHRRVGAAPSLGAIAEEVVGAAPARRHAAVVSTATAGPQAAPPRRHAATGVTTAAAAPAHQAPHAQPQAVLPSPGTKQQVVEKRHEARFPSIMFHPQPAAPMGARRGSVEPPARRASMDQPAEQQQDRGAAAGPRPLPSVLAPARASLSPRQAEKQQKLAAAALAAAALQRQQQQQRTHPVLAQALAAKLAAEAAAAVGAAESEDEEAHFMDADSGGGSGGLSLENSAVWTDADQHSPLCMRSDAPQAPAPQPAMGQPHQGNGASHLVIQEDDAISVASDASTVVHGHEQDGSAEQELTGFEGVQEAQQEQWAAAVPATQLTPAVEATAAVPGVCAAAAEEVAQPAELPDVAEAPLPPLPRESLLLQMAEQEAVHQAALAPLPPLSAAGELFQSASLLLPVLQGGLASGFEGAAAYRASLSPGVSVDGRRSSLIGGLQQASEAADATLAVAAAEASQRVSLAGDSAKCPAPATAEQSDSTELHQEHLQAEFPAEGAAGSPAPSGACAGAPAEVAEEITAPTAEVPPASSTGGCSDDATDSAAATLHGKVSRLSMASSTATVAPSLNFEYSEASLRYSMEHAPHSPRSHASQELPPALAAPDQPLEVAATPQQHRHSMVQGAAASPPAVPANTPASPALSGFAAAAMALRAAEEDRSRPVAAAAVAHAIERAGAEEAERCASLASVGLPAGRTGKASRRASLACVGLPAACSEEAARRVSLPSGWQPTAGPDVLARRASLASGVLPEAESEEVGTAEVPALTGPAHVPAQSPVAIAPASPVPSTPGGATEFDGDNVVMMDIDSTPKPTTGRRPPPGTSRFQVEAAVAASAEHNIAALSRTPAIVYGAQVAAHAQQDLKAATDTAAEVKQALAAAVAAVAVAAIAGEAAGEAAVDVSEATTALADTFAASEAAERDFLLARDEEAEAEPFEEQAAAASLPAVQAPSQQSAVPDFSTFSLSELAPAEAAARRGRAARLSMPAAGMVDTAEHGPRRSRLSLPSSGPWAAASEELFAFERRPRLSMSPVVAPPLSPLTTSDELQPQSQPETDGQQEQLPAEPQQEDEEAAEEPAEQQAAGHPAWQQPAEQQPAEQPAAEPAEQPAEQTAHGEEEEASADVPFTLRSRLVAEDGEVPAAAVPAAVEPEEPADMDVDAQLSPAGQQRSTMSGLEAQAEEPAAQLVAEQAVEQPQMRPQPVADTASPVPSSRLLGDEEALAAAAFASKPRHSLSPAVSSGSQRSFSGQQQVHESEEAAAFAPKPRLSMSPAVSSGSQRRLSGQGGSQLQQGVEGAGPVFASKPRLSMSPAVSSGSQAPSHMISQAASLQQQEDEDAMAAAAFAAKPKIAMSPAVSSASQSHIHSQMGGGHSPVDSKPGKPDVTYGTAAAAAASLLKRQQQAQHSGEAASPAASVCQEQQQEEGEQEQLLEEEGQWVDSPTMSSNPLAGAGSTPVPSTRRFSHSPAPSGLSAGAFSNNPMYAGTPSHPTPPSVNLKNFSGRAGMAGTPQSAASGGSTPASTGIRLAERLHQVAEQLQNPAAPQGLAALATPGVARLGGGGGRTPATGRFEFAEDVQAIFQALEARTPGTALGQQPALGRAAAVATTVQRQQGGRPPRYSFAAQGNTLLDLDSYDVHGDRSGQAGPTPLLRQQLLGGTTPSLSATSAGVGGAPRSAGAAATGLENKALRDQVAALNLQVTVLTEERDGMSGLLGGYQSSIRELQDQQSVEVVRLQGENAALRAETDELRRAHSGVDEQFRTLYTDKYVPLKAEAAAMRRELGAMQKRVMAEELKAHKAASDAQAARQELAAAQQRVQDYKGAVLEAQAEAVAAREAEQRLQQLLAGEQRRLEKAVSSKEAEAGELRAKYGTLTKQYDEAVHRINLAKQARERAQLEVQRKEEEVVAVEVRLKEYEAALREYKRENGKAFEMKERYKAAIAALEKEVQTKDKEKQELLGLCNDLMTRLEREGIVV